MYAGSVLSAAGSVPAPRASAEDWASMVNEMQKGALLTRLGIPIIYGADANHGSSNVYRATLFPHNIGLGATRYSIPRFVFISRRIKISRTCLFDLFFLKKDVFGLLAFGTCKV